MAIAVLAAQQHGGIAGELGLPDRGVGWIDPNQTRRGIGSSLGFGGPSIAPQNLVPLCSYLRQKKGGVMPEPSRLVASAAGLMQGGGFYNRHGWVQAAGITAALPALARAAAAVPIELPLIVADHGSSQGRNSLRPMRIAIEGLRAREPGVPITLVHIDQPGNDFSSLFTVLNNSPESYLKLSCRNLCSGNRPLVLRSRAAAIQRHVGLEFVRRHMADQHAA
jgi:hypothetical protein